MNIFTTTDRDHFRLFQHLPQLSFLAMWAESKVVVYIHVSFRKQQKVQV